MNKRFGDDEGERESIGIGGRWVRRQGSRVPMKIYVGWGLIWREREEGRTNRGRAGDQRKFVDGGGGQGWDGALEVEEA